MEKAKEMAREKGYAETLFHRRRYLPEDVYKRQLIDTERDARNLYDYLLTFNILSLDTETTSTAAIDAELVQKRLLEYERVQARAKLAETEKRLSGRCV